MSGGNTALFRSPAPGRQTLARAVRTALGAAPCAGGRTGLDRRDGAGPGAALHAAELLDESAQGGRHVQVPIPINFPPGPAVLTTVLEYRCNALQDVLRPIGMELNMAFEVLS